MLHCANCRNPLLEGQVLCTVCGYDQRKSVGQVKHVGCSTVLIVALWILVLLPAAGVACLATCGSIGFGLEPIAGRNNPLLLVAAFGLGIVAALAVVAGGVYLTRRLK